MDITLLYIMDPLCGWCFGFSPVMKQVQEDYPQFKYHVITGGMMAGEAKQPFSTLAGYVLKAYHRVEDFTGVKFGEPYLDLLREGNEMGDSEPPCRAIHAFQQLRPGEGVAFAHALQHASFVKGKSLNSDTTYAELATQFGLNGEEFLEKMNSEENKYGTVQDWQWCKAAGITGFPCLVLQAGDQYFMVAQGFRTLEDVKVVIDKLLSLPEVKI